jgi:hypothetical protein
MEATSADGLSALISTLFEQAPAEKARNDVQFLVAEVIAPSIPQCPFQTSPPAVSLTTSERALLLDCLVDRLLQTYTHPIPEHLQELLVDEAFIATLLLLPRHEAFFSILSSEVTMPALLLLLTYSSSQRSSVSSLLTRALLQKDGVYHFIKNLAKGEDRLMMKTLAVQVLISFPRGLSTAEYVEGVLTQMMDMLLQFKCDVWFQAILTESVTKIVQKKPELCSVVLHARLIKLLQDGDDVTSVPRAYKALLSYEPPHDLVLYTLEVSFPSLAGLLGFAFTYRILGASKEVLEAAGQFLKHSQYADVLMYNWLVLDLYEVPVFLTDSEGRVLRGAGTEEVEGLAVLMWLTEALEKSPALLHFYSKLFSRTLQQFKEDGPMKATALILMLSEKFSPTELVSSPKQLEGFLTHLLKSDDEETLQGALSLIAVMLESCEFLSEDKLFLLKITPRVQQLKAHADPLISGLAQRADLGISATITSVSAGEEPPLVPSEGRDPSPSCPFDRALALHKLALSSKPVLWREVEGYLEETDLFVLENFLALVINKVDIIEFCEALDAFPSMTLDVQLRMLEVLYRYLTCPARRPLLKVKDRLAVFVRTQLTSQPDSSVSSKPAHPRPLASPPLLSSALASSYPEGPSVCLSVLSISSALFKRFGDSLHELLPFVLQTSLQIIKLSTSRVYTAQPTPTELPGALRLVKSVVVSVSVELLADYVQDIKEHLSLLLQLYSADDACKQLLDQAVGAFDAKMAGQIGYVD